MANPAPRNAAALTKSAPSIAIFPPGPALPELKVERIQRLWLRLNYKYQDQRNDHCLEMVITAMGASFVHFPFMRMMIERYLCDG